MAPVYDKISSLNPIRDNWNVLTRVIRLWSTRGGGQITGIDFILMDDQGSRIQATVRKHLAPKYEKLIREGAVYAIRNFTLANNTGGFRVANHEYKITIQGETIALLQSDSLVPPTIWDFVKYDDVLSGALDESLLVDVIGMLSRVGEQRNFGGGKKMKQIVLDNFGVELTCSFWGHYIDEIDQFLTANGPTNAIVVIMCGKIKEFQGRRTIQNGLHCCKILFNPTFPIALEFKNKMLLSIPNSQQGVGRIVDASQVSLEDDFLNFHERKTLAELKDPAIDADKCYIVEATIKYLLDPQGWWYNVCSCNKPVQPDSVSYYCGPCDCRVVNVQTRYRIRIKVIDETDSTNAGEDIWIPRMSMVPNDPSLPFKFERRQFPVTICFAMTINKSQGQTLSNVGLYLRNPVFTHGQLYVAISRVRSKRGLKVLILDDESKVVSSTKNVVYSEVFDNL
ncbi:hypothetical protein OROMI_003980 [Orobanche minor]